MNAQVWQVQEGWSEDHERAYSEWIQESLNADIFSNTESPYYGIKTDCADAALVVRAIYSYEHKLPFSFVNVDGEILNQSTSLFDHYPLNKRFFYFANSLSDQISVNSLARFNSFSIHPKSIRPGDFYFVRWQNSQGQFNHHAYIIKSILPSGDFEFYSSTTPKMKRTLGIRRGMPLQFFTEAPFGFRRFKESTSDAPRFSDNTQYDWQKLGEFEFFKKVKNELKTEEDTIVKNFERRFFNLCNSLNLRYELVLEAQNILRQNGDKCFGKKEFDEYSTPSRDNNIAKEFERIIQGWKTILLKNMEHDLSSEEVLGLNYLIGKDHSEIAKNALDLRCKVFVPLSNNQKKSMGLRDFYLFQKQGRVSSNPNDSVLTRYGIATEKNLCK